MASLKMVFLFGGLFFCSQLMRGQSRPNIVLILADDLGYGDLGCYNDDSKIPTPNLDRLATQGLRFTDAHSPSSVCTPTRYGILTGRYCWRTELKKSVLWPWQSPLIETDRLTLPEMLKMQDYETACVGKWHLGWQWRDSAGLLIPDLTQPGVNDRVSQTEFAAKIDFTQEISGGPLDHGFDYYFGDDVPNFPPYVFIENKHTLGLPTTEKPSEMFGHAGPAIPGWDLSMVMPTLTQKICKYLDERSTTVKPFFLFVPLTAPHTPIAPSPHFIGRSGAGWYGDYVAQVDWTVGQIMDALKRNDFDENTLVIFTSDNGSPQRDGSNMNGATGTVKEYGHDPSKPWRGMKSDSWEGGHRVPMIVRWPDISPPGEIDEPIVLVDLMRTMASIVNFRLPTNAAEDSYDYSAVFKGNQLDKPVRDHLIHHSGNGFFSIRIDQWKLILGRDSGGFTKFIPPADAPEGQLYDLENDAEEKFNVYDQYPDIVQRLTSKLIRIQAEGRSHD